MWPPKLVATALRSPLVSAMNKRLLSVRILTTLRVAVIMTCDKICNHKRRAVIYSEITTTLGNSTITVS